MPARELSRASNPPSLTCGMQPRIEFDYDAALLSGPGDQEVFTDLAPLYLQRPARMAEGLCGPGIDS